MRIKKILLLLVLGVLINPLMAQVSTTDSLGTKFLIPTDFKSQYEKAPAQLVDVRTPDEFKKSHLPAAININYYSPDFLKSLDQLDKNKPVFVYCATGGRSKGTTTALRQKGFTQLNALLGFYSDLGLLYGINPEPVKRPNKY